MTGSKREGVRRLMLALGVQWTAWWAYRLWSDYRELKFSEYVSDISLRTSYAGAMLSDYFDARTKLQTDVLWALGAPLLLAAGYWVYRGFRSGAAEG